MKNAKTKLLSVFIRVHLWRIVLMLQLLDLSPNVWSLTTAGQFNNMRPAGYAPFLSKPQQRRLERIRQARMILRGQHKEYFLFEGRSQFEFPTVRVGSVWGNQLVQMYLANNMSGLTSRKCADLLFGEEPMLRVQQKTEGETRRQGDRCGDRDRHRGSPAGGPGISC
jgi:hypothetical protein